MKKIILLFLIIFCISNLKSQDYTTQLARTLSVDLFEQNGVDFMQPIVEVINSTSNSRFYTDAYIPTKVDRPYFRFSVNMMAGAVPDEKKFYEPYLPNEQYQTTDLFRYGTVNPLTGQINISDTSGLIYYFFRNLMYDGINTNDPNKQINVPDRASTALGGEDTEFLLPNQNLQNLANDHPLIQSGLIPAELQDSVLALIEQFPERFPLYGGNDLQFIAAGVPQLIVGSLYGTELLLRFVPKINMGETVGDFGFWGVGVRHSISQYFENDYVDVAIQGAIQGTSLENTVGVTNAKLVADAAMYNANIHASYDVFDNENGRFSFFTGFGYETISIETSYTYVLPVELQWQLGLLEQGSHVPTPGYPGDQNPQTTSLTLEDQAFKFNLGLNYSSPFGMNFYIDYNNTQFDIFTAGIEYQF